MFNINNVALMAADVFGTKITLNVKDKDGNFIEFISTDDFNSMSKTVRDQDKDQDYKEDRYNQEESQ